MLGPQDRDQEDDEYCLECGRERCDCDREPADIYYDDDGDCYDY